MVVNPDTGNTRTVVPCTGERCVYIVDPAFSPDGHSIAYSRTVAPPNAQNPPVWKLYSAIFIVGLDGKNSHQVTSTPKRRKGQPATLDTLARHCRLTARCSLSCALTTRRRTTV